MGSDINRFRNHRTSISMAQWYLESIETGFSFPDFATEAYNWKTWVNDPTLLRSLSI